MEKPDLVAVADLRRGDAVYSPATIRRKIRLGLLPSYRIAGRVYIDRRVLEDLARPVLVPARPERGAA